MHGSCEALPACRSGELGFNNVGLELTKGGPSWVIDLSISLFFKVEDNGSPRLRSFVVGLVGSETVVLSVAMVALLVGLP